MKERDKSKLQQVFHRTIHGNVAGRDVLNIDLGNCTEYEAQHHFEQCTRIRCTRQGREQLVHLAEHCDFGFPELRRAIGGGAMVWNRESMQWRLAPAWLDYGAALFFGVLGALLALSVATAVWPGLSSPLAIPGALLMGALYFVLVALLFVQFILPHRIARRAISALHGCEPGGGARCAAPCRLRRQ